MALVYDRIKRWDFSERVQAYGSPDLMLYALGIGMGERPTDVRQLPYVYERELRAFPTFAVTLGYPGLWMRDQASGIDWVRIVHAEQRLRLHMPLAPSGRIRARNFVSHVVDKGRETGAVIVTQRVLSDADSGVAIAELAQTTFCRGDGGFGGGDAAPPALPAVPARAPDCTRHLSTLPQQALMYRLNGDMNPLHVDPEVARAAGFERPILHGLCTYGLAARALIDQFAAGDGRHLAQLDVRFTRPFFPGETLAVRMWASEGGAAVQFEALAVERNVQVLSHGVARLVGITPHSVEPYFQLSPTCP